MSVSADQSYLQHLSRASTPTLFDEPLLTRIHELLAMSADTAAWWTALAHRIDDLADALWEHRTAMESPTGLFQDVLEDAPRLTFTVRSLERDLQELTAEVAQLRLLVSASMARHGGVPRAIESASETMAHLRAHHSRVHTLLYEAYTVDLGDSG